MVARIFASCLLGALLLAAASPARAVDELHLPWDNCITDGGAQNKVFACDANTGTEVLVASYRLDSGLQGVTGMDAVISIATLGNPVPDWWQFFNRGSCRQPSLSMSFSGAPGSNCVDLWSGFALGGVTGYRTYTTPIPTPAPLFARITASFGVAEAHVFDVPAGAEVFAFRLAIDHARTMGSPSCAGCSPAICLAWAEANLTRGVGVGDRRILGSRTPDNGSNVTWQTGAVATTRSDCCNYAYVYCQSVTPAQNRTWGTIKSLYR